jgi:hydrogenase nickel incorporation protein HypA/HybF
MHELSIALSLVDVACEEMSRLGAVRVNAVHLRLGPLSGVARDALLFSFDAAAAGTTLEGARLEIQDVPVTIWCSVCAAERSLVAVACRRCPVCHTAAREVVRGEELELIGLEVVDA